MSTGQDTKRVSLVLGSGAARGYAHIGVIHELEARGYEIVGVSGSSMGALVGGLHAAGCLEEFIQWASSLTQSTIVGLLDPSFEDSGIFRADKVFEHVAQMIGPTHIQELPITYTAVATDLVAGKTVWLQRGSLAQAIRASIAIPGLITPYRLGGRLLADGGILDPLPIAPIAGVQADWVIAVSLAGEENHYPHRPSHKASPLEDEGWAHEGILDHPMSCSSEVSSGSWPWGSLETVVDRIVEKTHPHQIVTRRHMNSFEVMNRSIDIGQSALIRHQLAFYPPDVLISVPRNVCHSLDFHRAHEMITLGQQIARHSLDTAQL